MKGSTARSLQYGITYLDLDRIRSVIPGVAQVVPMRIVRETARFGAQNAPCQIVGTVPEYVANSGLEVVSGRFLTEVDERYHAGICAISEHLADTLMPYQEPLGASIRVGSEYFRVVGVVRERGTADKRPQSGDTTSSPLDGNVYIPLATSRSRLGETIIRRSAGSFEAETVELHQLIVRMVDTAAVETGTPLIRSLLERFHNAKDFEMIVPLQLLRQAEQTKRIFNIVLGSIAGISLLVGGIGIMNIMLATVTERTREIGIRRALGAKKRDITTQFLVETVVLSIGGGLIGVVAGVAIPVLVSAMTDMQTIVTPGAVILSFGISGLVGIVFGIYPASRAAGLDPIEALRHE
jgi:putative ABC transport system permease protein